MFIFHVNINIFVKIFSFLVEKITAKYFAHFPGKFYSAICPPNLCPHNGRIGFQEYETIQSKANFTSENWRKLQMQKE